MSSLLKWIEDDLRGPVSNSRVQAVHQKAC